ncbi:glycosyltransferase N-terminal domain-containing protein [Hydrogenophaga sp.]|uniref:3-deoxy-D-manno-octulosonic acid transferase n=1 Tax=Hydrogenophaga sp. TaxID=1904254 RepID=UPI0025C6177B|nr:glycosyltransferase N-terminal domain-containing protein [Hydrogenophaga sp.]
MPDTPHDPRPPLRRFPPSRRMAGLIALYQLLWHSLLPVVFLFLWRRGRREPLYRQFWGERFGNTHTPLHRPLWVHSASMGELRGAAPLVRALLAEGLSIVITTLTPAGRTAAQQLFDEPIAQGRLAVAYLPLELGWAVRRFIRQVNPRAAVMTEIDTWPVLLATLRTQGVPLAMANAQYPKESFIRDRKRWWGFRAALFQAYELVLCKSDTHAQRFRQLGCERVVIAGETRFDLPASPQQLHAASELSRQWGLATHTPSGRPVVCFASVVVGEDATFVSTMQTIRQALAKQSATPPLFVCVPRSPQRFDESERLLAEAGLRVVRRSACLDAAFQPDENLKMADVDVLLGDSLGEMYFYLALSQVVVVGGSFVDTGAHNVIEPLALKKPVMVGPSIWGIEYPGAEALAAGVLQQHADANRLAQALLSLLTSPQAYAQATAGAAAFFAEHGGATDKHMATLMPWLQERAP